MSSTLYSAALRADLGIVSRSNHSMPVNYLPLGQDAAVADYGPDLKFKNNTGNHIYIQAFSNGGSITTRIFGTNTGKNVEVSSQVISRTNDKITAVTYKKVTQNGEVISNGQISKAYIKALQNNKTLSNKISKQKRRDLLTPFFFAIIIKGCKMVFRFF